MKARCRVLCRVSTTFIDPQYFATTARGHHKIKYAVLVYVQKVSTDDVCS